MCHSAPRLGLGLGLLFFNQILCLAQADTNLKPNGWGEKNVESERKKHRFEYAGAGGADTAALRGNNDANELERNLKKMDKKPGVSKVLPPRRSRPTGEGHVHEWGVYSLMPQSS